MGGANGILTQSSEICDVGVCVCGGGDHVTTDNDTDVKHSAAVVFFFTRLSGLI